MAADSAEEPADAGGVMAGGERGGQETGHYEALKQRVISNGPRRRRGSARREAQPEGAEFIELSGFPALGPSAVGDEMVVEMVAADGTRLTIRVKGVSPNVSALINAFRGRS
jgi:hypothetical protein